MATFCLDVQRAPFGGRPEVNTGAIVRSPHGPPTARRVLVRPRVPAALAVVLIVAFTASGARLAIPGLREATRATTPKEAFTRAPIRWRANAQASQGASGGTPSMTGVRPAVAQAERASRPEWVGSTATPRPPGDARGRLLSRALGGHGRHGPGAGI